MLVLVEHYSAILWSVASGIGGLLGAFFLTAMRIRGETAAKLTAAKEQIRDELLKEITLQEVTERSAFRASLMTEVSELRRMIRECEVDRASLNERLNAYGGELKLLNAECDIMKMQMKYGKDLS